jgi:hypothetical protein
MAKRRERLSDETIDGLMLEMQLSSDPKILARRDAFWAKVKNFREKTAEKSKEEMIAELKAHNPGYILQLLNARPEPEIREKYVMTFVHLETAP